MILLSKTPRTTLSSFTRFAAAAAGLALFSVGARADDYARGHVLARLAPRVNEATFLKDYNTTVLDRVPATGLLSLKVPTGTTETAFAAKLALDKRVVFGEPDHIAFSGVPQLTNKSPFGGTQYHYAFDGGQDSRPYVNQGAYKQVNLGAANTRTTGAGVVVAVLDTGATFGHPALAKNYLPGFNVIRPDLAPTDVADGVFNHGVGHGTMVAGIIVRLAPNVKILPVKVLNGDGLGTILDIAKGIDYAVRNGARVINMSFGGTVRSGTINDALDQAELAGVVTVAAAGNEGLEQEQYPAKGNGTLAVGSVESTNVKADYSNYGSFVRVVAPGTGISSTYWTGGYASWSGTSFAAPFVSAEAALIIGAKPTLTGALIKDLIRNTAKSVDGVNKLYKGKLGKGIIDIDAAVKSIR